MIANHLSTRLLILPCVFSVGIVSSADEIAEIRTLVILLNSKCDEALPRTREECYYMNGNSLQFMLFEEE